MRRFFLAIMACALAGPATASTSLLESGMASWFYQCANHEPMTILILHIDGTSSQFALGPGEMRRTYIRRGDLATWRCDAWPVPPENYRYVPTLPAPE